jgi:branched-chain amino acid aminotransferase
VTATTAPPRLSETYVDRRPYPHGVAFIDGGYFPMSEAKISVLDWGFLHSDATYDTVHVWQGRFFRLDLHIERFFGSVDRLRLKVPFNRQEITDILMNCVALSKLQDAYVEMICTRGASPTFSRDPRHAENRFLAFAIPFGSVANAEQKARGLRVAVSKVVRIPPRSVDPRIKNYHWLDLVMGLFDAYDSGAETALLQDGDGNVAEGPGFNVFVVKDGRMRTPASGVLPGITRRTVFDLAGELGIAVREASVPLAELGNADEVFITSTAGGIMGVAEIDGQKIAGGVGPVTRRLADLYWEKHRDPAWSTPVDYAAGAGE